jgi:tetratricopeptide (TPR) repeat protein
MEFLNLLVLISIAGAFGGFLSALLNYRTSFSKDRSPNLIEGYFLPCPLNPGNPKPIKIGFLGDIALGLGAGICSFIALAGIMGVNITRFSPPEELLRLTALGIIAGFMGPSLLKSLTVTFQTFLVKQETQLEEAEERRREVEERMQKYSYCLRLVQIGDAFAKWDEFEKAIAKYDEAIAYDPTYMDAILHKSFVYAEQGDTELNEDKKKEKYRAAAELAEKAIGIDREYGRSYYNRACYLYLAYGEEKKGEVLENLRTAIKKNDMLAEMARYDPDLKDSKGDALYHLL